MGTNIATGATSQCVSGTDTCEDGYSCDAARARKPGLFAGCTFDSSTASESSVTGVIMDGFWAIVDIKLFMIVLVRMQQTNLRWVQAWSLER